MGAWRGRGTGYCVHGWENADWQLANFNIRTGRVHINWWCTEDVVLFQVNASEVFREILNEKYKKSHLHWIKLFKKKRIARMQNCNKAKTKHSWIALIPLNGTERVSIENYWTEIYAIENCLTFACFSLNFFLLYKNCKTNSIKKDQGLIWNDLALNTKLILRILQNLGRKILSSFLTK